MENIRYLLFKGEIIPLYLDLLRNLWIDKDGTTYAFAENANSTDPIARCGINMLSFPTGSPLDDACKAHDFKYSSPTYQFYHIRAEADAALLRDLKQVSRGSLYYIFATPFYYIARLLGGKYWENKDTR